VSSPNHVTCTSSFVNWMYSTASARFRMNMLQNIMSATKYTHTQGLTASCRSTRAIMSATKHTDTQGAVRPTPPRHQTSQLAARARERARPVPHLQRIHGAGPPLLGRALEDGEEGPHDVVEVAAGDRGQGSH